MALSASGCGFRRPLKTSAHVSSARRYFPPIGLCRGGSGAHAPWRSSAGLSRSRIDDFHRGGYAYAESTI
jgi:hypothetical protein